MYPLMTPTLNLERKIKNGIFCWIIDFQNAKEQMDKMAFMQEVERDAVRRAEERKERESVAQNLRK